MDDRTNINQEMNMVQYASFPEIFGKMKELSADYGSMPMQNLINAFGMIGGINNVSPSVQNRRVKGVSTLPVTYSKDEVADFVIKPNSKERELREVAHSLEYSSYPMFHTRKTYSELLTYHNYIMPNLPDKASMKRSDFMREWTLLEKVRKEFNPKAFAHQVAGQVGTEGKVFYFYRVAVDKSHNTVRYAFPQQLPSDWVKIVGLNNKSKYTLAFNMMYFAQFGTDYRQFGDLFKPYIEDFNKVISPAPMKRDGRIIYASATEIDLEKASKLGVNAEVYGENRRWYYWVTLPVERVHTIEADDVSRNVVSPFTGLFIDMIQLSQLSAIQLNLVQNPLVSIVTGEIPYFESKDSNIEDQYKLSNAGRTLFETLFYNMLQATNTSGIGFFSAPLQNMKLHSLAEAPSAMDIVSKGYTDTMAKAGLTAIIPTSSDSRAGAVNVSLMIESKFLEVVYQGVERMFNCMIASLHPKYEWEFKMFGNLATDAELEKNCRTEMTLGILPATIIYNALHDRSILDDIVLSQLVADSGLLENRIPLQSTYSARYGDSNYSYYRKREIDSGGRPSSEGTATSDGNEQDIDSGTSGSFNFE